MTRVLRARAEAEIHSSLCLFGKRKGVCGLSLGKQSGDSVAEGRLLGCASLSSHTTCLCVYIRGAKGTLVQAMTSGQPSPAPITFPPPCTLCTATAERPRATPRCTRMTNPCA